MLIKNRSSHSHLHVYGERCVRNTHLDDILTKCQVKMTVVLVRLQKVILCVQANCLQIRRHSFDDILTQNYLSYASVL